MSQKKSRPGHPGNKGNPTAASTGLNLGFSGWSREVQELPEGDDADSKRGSYCLTEHILLECRGALLPHFMFLVPGIKERFKNGSDDDGIL